QQSKQNRNYHRVLNQNSNRECLEPHSYVTTAAAMTKRIAPWRNYNMDELIERCIDCIPLAICCFLIVRGADLSAKNKQMLTPFDILVSDQSCKVLLPTFNSFSVMKTQPASRGVGRNLTNVSSVSRLQSQSNSVMSSGITPSSFPQSSIALSSSSSPPLSAMSDSKTNDVESDVCRACNELKANVRYEPCNHILFCVKCISQQSHKMCSRCDMPIKARIGPTGEVKAVAKSQNSPIDMQCPICMERLKNMAPACGHTLCRECARNLSECPFCRGPMVELRQTVYPSKFSKVRISLVENHLKL
uniref:RING-type domain-containing protein n=1 Tax=Romanomermis culicivorax TaxID=13658 RepID=A0A915JSC0_ROMCU